MLALWIGLIGCAPRQGADPGGAAAAQACTLRLATLPNSAWQDGDTTLRFATDTLRYSRGEQSRLYVCSPAPEEQALRCMTTPDVLAWCRARLANRRACERELIMPYAGHLSDAQIGDAIVEAAEEHARIAGTEQEGYFTERYAAPEEPLLHVLQLRPDPAACQLSAQEAAVRVVGGEWREDAGAARTFSPIVP